MNSRYASALASLNTLHPLGIRPGLERIRALLKALGNPERGMQVVHVAGSNGKGSVCRMIESVLIESGLRTGMFISPHLVEFRERFRINGVMTGKAELAAVFPKLERALKNPAVLRQGPPTYFEAVTALAFLIFKRQRCKILVLETGLGGRFDSTNVIPRPLLTVITNISLEHTQILGKTEEKIAWEKAGILKAGSPLVTAAQGKALSVIKRTFNLGHRTGAVSAPDSARPSARLLAPDSAGQLRSASALELIALSEGANWRIHKQKQHLEPVPGQSLEIEVLGKKRWLFIPLLGQHQQVNLATALASVELLKKKLPISEETIARGLACADWPGRLQLIARKPLTVLDGAHNPAGARVLARALKAFGAHRVLMVAGVLKDKDWHGIFRALSSAASRFYLTRPADARGLEPAEVSAWLKKTGWPASKMALFGSARAALTSARRAARKGDLIVACGSLYTVGEILSASGRRLSGR